MYIRKAEVEKILEILNSFPEADGFRLDQDNSSGIGSVVSITISTQVNGHHGEFKIEISGVENW